MKQDKTIPYISDLDTPLIKISLDKKTFHSKDEWCLRDAVRGVLILGSIGSGKSSGSGKNLALKYLKSGFGGIVLTGKVDETLTWLKYAYDCGLWDQVIVFGEKNKYEIWIEYLEKNGKHEEITDKLKQDALDAKRLRFNPLEYEMRRNKCEGGGHTENLVNLFSSTVRMGNRITGSSGENKQDEFWQMAMERCLKSVIDLLKIAVKGKEIEGNLDSSQKDFEMTIANIARVISEAPKSGYHVDSFIKLSNSTDQDELQELQNWANRSYTVYALCWAKFYMDEKKRKIETLINGVTSSERDEFESEMNAFDVALDYFLNELSSLNDKTRSCVVECVYSFANHFRSGLLADYFSKETSDEILPEKTFEGKIIILDFPVKKYLQLGVFAQAIYKRIWQQAIERRDLKDNDDSRPLFLWVDESQYFINEEDMMFQTTARSAKACTVLISQNISNFYAVIGGNHPIERVNSLLGNLCTKIMHANNDSVTNIWASDAIGKTFKPQLAITAGTNAGSSISEALHYQIEPVEFTILACGGPDNNFNVEGIMAVTGKQWSNGKNHCRIGFSQK